MVTLWHGVKLKMDFKEMGLVMGIGLSWFRIDFTPWLLNKKQWEKRWFWKREESSWNSTVKWWPTKLYIFIDNNDDAATWKTYYLYMCITRQLQTEKSSQILVSSRSCEYLLICSSFLPVGNMKYAAWWEKASARETASWNIPLQNRHFLQME